MPSLLPALKDKSSSKCSSSVCNLLAPIFSLVSWVFGWDFVESIVFVRPKLRKEAIRLVEGTADTASKNNKIARLYPAKPNLKVVDSKSPNIEQSSSEMTNIKQVRPQLKVINGGKNEGKWVKVANGSEVFIPQVTNTSNHVILDSIEDLSSYNNIFGNITKSSRLGTDAVQSTNNIDALKDNSVFTQDSSTDIVEEVKEVSKEVRLHHFMRSICTNFTFVML